MLFNIEEAYSRSILVFIALSMFFVSELLLVLGSSSSIVFKLIGLFILIGIILTARYIHKISIILIPLFVILIYNFYTALNYNAASEELLRFLLPIIIILSLYANLNLKTLARLLIYLVISNDFFQVFYYVSYFLNFPLLYEPRIEYSYILRAEGWVGFFSLFGFLNFCGYLLVSKGDFPKERKYKNIFLAFMFLSTSLKVIIGYFVYLLMISDLKKIRLEFVIVITLAIISIIAFGGFVDDYGNIITSKLNFYIFEGNSARSESYRVLYAEIMRGNLFGAGLGSFGGPASTAYDSVMYYNYNFDWFGLEGQLSTTDTFYPHLFIELGIFGGLLYLAFFIFYGYENYNILWFSLVVVFILDNVMSFSMLSPPYVMAALISLFYFQQIKLQEY